MAQVGIMQVTDTLSSGGTERVAVNIANHLPRDRYRVHLCTTRSDGPLASQVAGDVGRICLHRKRTLDLGAIRRMAAYVREHDIGVLHAHSTSLYTAVLASLLPPYPAVIWHDHYGKCAMGERPAWRFKLPISRAAGVIAVNQMLADWAERRLGVPHDRVWYVPNFVVPPELGEESLTLPGVAGSRIVCVANLRPQKDHLTLVRAMATVVAGAPKAHLILVGAHPDAAHLEEVKREIGRQGLERSITLLGSRQDVPNILRACDIGVLSSLSEAFPLSLIEYGLAGLASVSTEVGQCAEVLDEGRAGLLVPPGSPDELARALLSLLQAPDLRATLGARFKERVQARYTPGAVIEQICKVYDTLMVENRRQKTENRGRKPQITTND